MEQINVVSSPVFLTRPDDSKLSLAAVFATMARGEITSFPYLRPHQRAAWHMFLVQLGALALFTSEQAEIPEDETTWRALLLKLTNDDETPWFLVNPDDKPAFMQPPAPSGLKWPPLATPDALDLLITARNHDVKQTIARDSDIDEWIYALVSLQTSEGYCGAGNYGIARMNGGSSSRPMVGLAPRDARSTDRLDINPSIWWRRDVTRLLKSRLSSADDDMRNRTRPGLLWLLDWPEGKTLALHQLDPWFIEVCRRVRLAWNDAGRLTARRSTSKSARIDAKNLNGVVGDPWAPITFEKDGKASKSLTLGEGEWHYRRLLALLDDKKWKLPLLAKPDQGAEEVLLVTEALSRGNGKTSGWKSRVLPVPGDIDVFATSGALGTMAEEMLKEVAVFQGALSYGLAIAAADGDEEKRKKNAVALSRYADRAKSRLNRVIDEELFFPALWDRLKAESENDKNSEEARQTAFLRALYAHAKKIFESELAILPIKSIWRPRAEVNARRAFFGTVHKEYEFLFAAETKAQENAHAP